MEYDILYSEHHSLNDFVIPFISYRKVSVLFWASLLSPGKYLANGYQGQVGLQSFTNTISVTSNIWDCIANISGFSVVNHTIPTPSRGPNVIAFYTEDFTLISSTTYYNGGSVSIPSNATYLVFTLGLNATDTRTMSFS